MPPSTRNPKYFNEMSGYILGKLKRSEFKITEIRKLRRLVKEFGSVRLLIKQIDGLNENAIREISLVVGDITIREGCVVQSIYEKSVTGVVTYVEETPVDLIVHFNHGNIKVEMNHDKLVRVN